MSDPSDEASQLVVEAERIIDRLTNGFGVKSVTYNFLPTMRAMADWIERNRAAIAPNRERVRQVVREAALLVLEDQSATVVQDGCVPRLGTPQRRKSLEFCADAIADRCAEQLATPAVSPSANLSSDERDLVVEVCHDLLTRAMREERDVFPSRKRGDDLRAKEAVLRRLLGDKP